MLLAQKAALLLGGNQTIGVALAERFCRAGAKLVVATPALNQARTIVHELHQGGYRALPMSTNLSDQTQVKATIHQTVELLGQLDIVVITSFLLALLTNKLFPNHFPSQS